MNKSSFVISIDTELLWGAVLDPTSQRAQTMAQDKSKGRHSINTLLDYFDKYKIPATWAVVGHLFLDHCVWKNGIVHEGMPRFKNDWFTQQTCSDIRTAPLFYGKDIIQNISSRPTKHEIGFHSFSHIPFDLCSAEVAAAEFDMGIEIASQLGINLKSFVFPYNKIGHKQILYQKGFKIFRGEDSGAILHQKSLKGVMNAILRRFIPMPVEPHMSDGIWEIRSSMTCTDRYLHLPFLPRAKGGIERAIQSGEVFHVILHSHDLIFFPKLADDIEKLVRFASIKRDEGKLEIKTMGELVP